MEYRIAKGWRIAAVVFSIMFIIGGLAFLLSPWYDHNMNKAPLVAILVGGAFIALGAAAWADTLKSKLTIDNYSITQEGAFKRKSLLLADIKGYRTEKDYIFLVPESGKGALKISNYVENKDELRAWIEGKYPDVDMLVVEEETKEILADENFGGTTEERQQLLANAKKTATIFNVASTIIIFWLFIYPKPYQLAWVMALLVAPASLYILWHFKGLVTVNDTKKSAYPSLLPILFLVCLLAGVRAIIDYDIYLYNNVWKYMVGVAAALTAATYSIAYTGHQKNINKKPIIFALAALFALYGYGATVFVNCHFDTKPPQVFTEPVTDMRVSHGKSTTYYITTAPWGQYTQPKEMSVAKSLYNSLQSGDSVNIYLRPGQLGIPWYFVERQTIIAPPTSLNK